MQDEVLSKRKFKQGDIRVGSSANCYQRLRNHKRFGWLPIHIITKGMDNPTRRFGTERKLSAFYRSQIADGEEFNLINGD